MSRKEVVVGNFERRLMRYRHVTVDGCWEWTGAMSGSGYGSFRHKNRSIGVHKIAAVVWLGYDLDKSSSQYQVNHKCRNKLCFNPEHLYIGSQSANVNDGYRAGDFGWDFKRKKNDD